LTTKEEKSHFGKKKRYPKGRNQSTTALHKLFHASHRRILKNTSELSSSTCNQH